MPLLRKAIHQLSLALCLLALAPRARAVDPQDFAVEVSAQVQSTPARIVLFWPPGGSFITGYTVSRKMIDQDSWSPLASLPSSATSFTDSSVVLGSGYEYEIAASGSDGLNAYGYIYAGAEVAFLANRGRVVLIVDSTFSGDLGQELDRLQSDLVGDGWTVLRHDVARTDAPTSVRNIIQNDYYADPNGTKAVFLFGHVPVPYSGNINPDMHAAHLGAWPADTFYGDMNGTWTDSDVNSTSAEDPRNYNVPGDGKFDQSDIPGTVVLEVGRVDLADLPAFTSRTETDLLRQYLDKNHAYRQRAFTADRRGLIRDNFGDIDGDAPATDAWRAFAPLFGLDHIQVIGPGDFFPTLAGGSYLWAYGGGGGEYYQADGVGSTTDFVNQSPQAVFFMLHGSYFGDWDSQDNFLRASLASSGYGLAAAWTGLPHWFFHHMALGEPIGRSTMISQNNRGLYKNQMNLSAGQVHTALMGDPTLRLHMVAPPSNLIANSSDSVVTLNWTPSVDAVRGYYVYRADNPSGPFSRLTRSFVTTSAYTDVGAPPGQKVYMVRAVSLESTPSGTYYNPSQGAFATADAGSTQTLPVIAVEAINPNGQEAGAVEGDFVLTRSGPSDSPLEVNFVIGGNARNGVDYEAVSSSALFPANATSVWIPIKPVPDATVEGNETVTLNLAPSPAYTIGSPSAATVTIQDSPVNQPPQISSIPNQSTALNTAAGPIAFSVSDADTPAENLIVTASSSNANLVPNGAIALSGTGGNRSLTIQPAAGQAGTATITLSVSDGSTSASASFTLTVVPTSPSGSIQSIQRQANGATLIQFDGTAGQKYTVQASKDFSTWSPIGSGVCPPNPPAVYQDTQAQTGPCRFYRIEWQ